MSLNPITAVLDKQITHSASTEIPAFYGSQKPRAVTTEDTIEPDYRRQHPYTLFYETDYKFFSLSKTVRSLQVI